MEIILYKKSSYIIVLCKDAIEEIVSYSPEYFNKVVVIPTCVDTNQFIIQKKVIMKEHTFVLCQVGTIQTRYLINNTIIFFKEFKKRHKSKLLIINKNEKKELTKIFSKNSLNSNEFKIIHSNHSDIATIINQVDVCIFFPKKGFFKKGFFPTKIAEFLSCGIPIFSSSINNDVDEIILKNKLGVILNDLSAKSINSAIDDLFKLLNDFEFKERARNFVVNNLSVECAVYKHNEIYKNLLIYE